VRSAETRVIAAVRVGVALRRPPREDAVVYTLVAAGTDAEALLIACQLAAANPRVVMPVWAEIADVLEL
jgi:hypothetical protein